LPGAQPLAIGAYVRYVSSGRLAMPRVQPKATPNRCLRVKPDEPWTGRCVKEKIADDGKRHRCYKPEKHNDNVHACQCSVEWKQF
jgi:hypothetical protein